MISFLFSQRVPKPYTLSKMIQFYASNFQSTDCTVSANLYSELFGLKIVVNSGTHSELFWPDKKGILIFSKESKNCPVSPGTLTFRIDKEEWESFKTILFSRGFIVEAQDSKYVSVLDPWKNRIWFYFS
ncbi:hypothetical protein LEP1GSC132_1812 [Leptospira kirschneri str. 200803703]|nr:hypothetical protein LEP1GSC044_2336 [Leptospira kirschneri serovar Grippotyphosa str. RM52]EKP03543.1 hypothetical protein LEP1GSC018_3107 [Leptospira kirschneri str. 2008720114]EKQ81917.1 hypothetical protein LEP1GSC064_0156 [Leptospira kirschneri serovar Grippotyphosa str. Moskva]EKR09920.1 hypothetical protein LEP1GSC122_3175 [Leptospira kirschneri serovar Valbuzzi str. 200702274]EMK01154.1 hypothetical protein LEP1GSC176_1439 [Leptospira kirschneri str. MMD1493]EMK16295.1 hypothetical 